MTWPAPTTPYGAPPGAPVGRRVVTLVVAGFIAIVLAIVGLALPVPYVELAPNAPCDTLATCDGNTIISIPHHQTYPTTGHLYLTDVGIIGGPGHEISLHQALRGWFDSSIAVIPQDVIYPPEQSSEQTQQQNSQEMLQSQRAAKVAALNALHLLPIRIEVEQFSPHSPAQQAGVETGDEITSIDGQPVTSLTRLTALIGEHAVGDTVTVGVRRSGATHTYRVRTVRAPGVSRPIIGVSVQAVATGKLPFRIDIGLRNVGGPSAGLMFALGIYDKLTNGSLTGGLSIAGTGTIAADGTVGPIGGIEQKVVGASRGHASAFLVPVANCADAKTASHQGMQLIRVKDFAQALSALAALRGGQGVIHPC